LPGMREEWARDLIDKFHDLMHEQAVFKNALGLL